MKFKDFIKNGIVKKRDKDVLRAKSLVKSANQTIETAKEIKLKETTSKTIFRELYESFRQYCEAIGYLKGYKFLNHESISYFLDEILNENKIASLFDRYRQIRNSINYYGKEINLETVKEALNEIPKIIQYLEKYLKE